MPYAIELGLDTFGDATVDNEGRPQTQAQALRNVVDQAALADRVGLDFFAVGEHHRPDFAVSAPEVVLAAIAGQTRRIKLGSAVTVLSTDDPVRVFQRFSTLNALSNGRAEVVKTGLLAGQPLWELREPEQVRACAAFKSAVCIQDPHDDGPRNQLNLGHTFGHALEAAADYVLPHGRAVALGLLAALRLSGLPDEARVVRDVLAPEPVRVDRDAAWAALARDKKAERGAPRLVLLDAPGKPRWGVEVPQDDVRRALDELIA